MKKQLDDLNVKISEKEKEYQAFMTTIPVDVVSRSAEDEAKRSAMFDEYESLNNQGVVLDKAFKDDLKLRAYTAEHNARQNDQTSGAEYRSATTSGMEVSDKPIYPNPATGVGQQCQDIAMRARGRLDGVNKEAIARSCQRLERCDQRRIHLMNRVADPVTQMEKVPSLGGIFLEVERSQDILEMGYNNSELAKRCVRRRMSPITGMLEVYGLQGNLSRVDGERNGSVKWMPIDELKEAMRSQVKYENKLTVQPTKLGAGYNASKEIVRDVPFLTGEINGLFTNEWAFSVQSYIWEGLGAKEPMVGIKNCDARYIQPKNASQGAGTVIWENIIQMYMHMYGGGFGSAFWAKTKWLEQQLIEMQIPTGDSAQLTQAYKPGGSTEAPATLYGSPAVTLEQCDIPGSVGDIAYLDMSQYLLTDKGSMDASSSVEVEFWSDQWAFKFTVEIDGQSRWISQGTPYKAPVGEKESPFIFLAPRVA